MGMRKIFVIAVLAVSGVLCGGASAQQSAQELQMACETNPGNVVIIDRPTKIFGPETLHVDSGCMLMLRANANLEVEARLIFAGHLDVRSTEKVDIKLAKTLFVAPSISFNVTGNGSSLGLSETVLRASEGGLLVTLGDEVKMQVNQSGIGNNGSPYDLGAEGVVRITGGRKVLISLAEIWVGGRLGVEVAMNGPDGALKVEETYLYATEGSVAITSSGRKALVEIQKVDFWPRDTFTTRLSGAESAVILKNVQMAAGPGVGGRLGDVTIVSGSGSSSDGKIEAANLGIYSHGSVNILGSLNGDKGIVKLDRSSVDSLGHVVIESGPRGTTEVKMGRTVGASVRVATGQGGSCVWQEFPGHTTTPCSP